MSTPTHHLGQCLRHLPWLSAYTWIFPLELLKNWGIAAMFHDIGKVLLPKDVLNKPGKLTVKEFEVMQRHPSLGFCLLDQHGRI